MENQGNGSSSPISCEFRNCLQTKEARQIQVKQSTMAFQWQDLPEDIKLEILSRLPPKSLLRSRCVCKHWLSLFSNPSFIRKHLLHRTTTAYDDDNETLLINTCTPASTHLSLLVLNSRNNPNPITFNLNLPFPDNNHCGDMELVGSINGLVCLSSRTDGSILIIWNPATKQYLNVPTPSIKLRPSQGGISSLGFCFDSLKNDYKIVRIVLFDIENERRRRPRVELYSVSTDCWREIEVEVPFFTLYSRFNTIVRGEPYWLAVLLPNLAFAVAWFDARKEVLMFQWEPTLGLREAYVYGLMNFKNSLAMLVRASGSSKDKNKWKFSLWVMEDDSSSWSMKFSTGPSNTLVGCSKNGEIVVFTERVLQLYNPKTCETSNIQIDLEALRSNVSGSFRFRVSDYTASLVPIRGSKQFEKEATTGGSQLPYFSTAKLTTSM